MEMEKDMSKNAFVSYAHADMESVNEIINIVRDIPDCNVWYDDNLRGGEHYFSVIAEQILKNEYFIFIVSDASISSSWCIQELEFAMSEKRKIIAIWLDQIELPPGVKFVIQNTHYIFWMNRDAAHLSEEIVKSFSEDYYSIKGNNSEIDNDDSLFISKRYFVDNKKINAIESLLESEKRNEFTRCFEAENAVLLGIGYELGIGTEKDSKKAEFYYRVGKFKNNLDAKYLYAALKILDDTENRSQYLADMEAAAEDGSILAMVYFGDANYAGSWGMPVDKRKAYKWWKKAAEQGNPVAMYFMSYVYGWDDAVEKDKGIALMYALNSSEYKFPRAFRALGFLYEDGDFVEKNLNKAVEYYNKAIEYGDKLSICYLGRIYQCDYNNFNKAFECYKQAEKEADEGNIKSGLPYKRVGNCYYYGIGAPVDKKLGIDYYFKAVEKNHESTKNNIVSKIEDAEDIDIYTRVKYLKKACDLNCKDAESAIVFLLQEVDNIKIEVINEILDLNFENSDEIIIEISRRGADKGQYASLLHLLSYYSFVLGKDEFIDRQKALDAFRLLFSVDAQGENLGKQLCTYYYSYAVELAIDENNKKPDIEHALFYFDKSLNTSFKHWKNIVYLGLAYLKPEISGGTINFDLVFGEAISVLAYKYINSPFWFSYENEFYQGCEELIDAFLLLEDFYKKGRHIKKNKTKASEYRQLADEVGKIKSEYISDQEKENKDLIKKFDELFADNTSND